MLRKVKTTLRDGFRTAGLDVRRWPRARSTGVYSNLDEQRVIQQTLDGLPAAQKYCVDIGASDGVSMSNSYALYRAGWNGLAVECDPRKFATLAAVHDASPTIHLAKCMVTPVNVLALLQANDVPETFGFLSLDIDGYDYFVLDVLLSQYRPALICAEINEKIPPPICFTVSWNPDYFWRGDHFFGQSIAQVGLLCERHRYALVELHYNNVFLVPVELASRPGLSPEEAYRTGYLNQPDRKEKFPWNQNVEDWLHLPPAEVLAAIQAFFEPYRGKFEASI